MTKPTCPVCDGEMIWDISADAARYICLWSEKQPEMHAQLAAAVAERDAARAEATMLHRALVDVMDWVRDFDFRDAAMKTLEQNATYEELRAMGFSGRSAWVDAKLEPLYAALAAAEAALADGDAAE